MNRLSLITLALICFTRCVNHTGECLLEPSRIAAWGMLISKDHTKADTSNIDSLVYASVYVTSDGCEPPESLEFNAKAIQSEYLLREAGEGPYSFNRNGSIVFQGDTFVVYVRNLLPNAYPIWQVQVEAYLHLFATDSLMIDSTVVTGTSLPMWIALSSGEVRDESDYILGIR